ncbi:MAG TPA: DUF2690 domain-containing protein [Myxococcaceae bacterium]|nr:DUF2690 domain-containing protein [Myxococcaceae bacterium]
MSIGALLACGAQQEVEISATSQALTKFDCQGSLCNCKDPGNDTYCNNDAITIPDSTYVVYDYSGGSRYVLAYVELRHSNHCKTNWSKVTFPNGPASTKVWLATTSGSKISCTKYPSSGYVTVVNAHGDMYFGVTRACAYVPTSYGSVNACTADYDSNKNY